MGTIKVRYFVKKTYFNKKAGKTVQYHYWQPKAKYWVAGKWVKCPLHAQELPDDEVKALEKAKELNQQLDNWRSGIIPEILSKEGSYDWLMCEYKKSIYFKKLAPRTAKEYGYIIDAIRKDLRARRVQNVMATAWTPQVAYALYESFIATPRKAQLVVAISRIVFAYGKKKIQNLNNPFEKLGIKKTPPREQIWLDLENPDQMLWKIIKMKQTALDMGLPSMAFAIDLGLFSLQREGDILHLAWTRYDGTAIRLRQKKVKKWVFIPMRIPVFKEILDSQPRTSLTMLISERTDKPYSKDHFGDVFREVRQRAGIEDELQFRDFRRTGIVLYGMSGVNPQEVSAISGHTIEETENILETYMPRNIIMAQNGMDKVNQQYGHILNGMKLEKTASTPYFGVGKI